MSKEYKFKSIRNKKGINKLSLKAPDYDSIIEMNNRHFTLVGWLGSHDSDISYKLQEITKERLDKDKYLFSRYGDYLLGRKRF
tara:strand:- start:804 stop:1052 length:249 start_codon:yes stop_codon:yes gene_type:complete